MSHREFVVPTDDEVLGEIGVAPEPDDDELRTLALAARASGEQVVLTYDVLGRSVSCSVTQQGATRLQLTRGGAVRLWVDRVADEVVCTVEFDTDSLGGRLVIRVGAAVSVSDVLLLH